MVEPDDPATSLPVDHAVSGAHHLLRRRSLSRSPLPRIRTPRTPVLVSSYLFLLSPYPHRSPDSPNITNHPTVPRTNASVSSSVVSLPLGWMWFALTHERLSKERQICVS